MYDENFIKHISDEKRNQVVSWYIDWRNAYPQCPYEYKIWFKWPSHKGHPIFEYSIVAFREKNGEMIPLAKINDIFIDNSPDKPDELHSLDSVALCTNLKNIGDYWLRSPMDFAKLMAELEEQLTKSPLRKLSTVQ